jgi:iron complex transport system substrate-binding protein
MNVSERFPMNIVSLMPGITEIVFALGLGNQLVGVSHRCDYPEEARTKPQVTGESGLNAQLLASLEPELILTAELGDAPVVAYEQVIAVAGRLPGSPRVATFDPVSIEQLFQAIHDISWLASHPERGRDLVTALEDRLEMLSNRLDGVEPRKVLCVRGLTDGVIANDWASEMVWRAGGVAVKDDPDLVVVIPRDGESGQAAVQDDRVQVVDDPVLFNRPGPRMIDGIEALAVMLHRKRFPPAL